MSTKSKTIIVTIICAIAAFLLGPKLWPHSMEMGTPTSGQLPFFIILSGAEAVIFGLGVSFLTLGWKKAKELSGRYGNKVIWSFFSLGWMLISWWPHDNLHGHIGMNLQKLLYIEYSFHFTLMIASVVVVWTLIGIVKKED